MLDLHLIRRITKHRRTKREAAEQDRFERFVDVLIQMHIVHDRRFAEALAHRPEMQRHWRHPAREPLYFGAGWYWDGQKLNRI